jgi:excinuclease ABC subunit C
LILEAQLIKQLKPRYNISLRDDKSYPYLYLSLSHPFPRLDFYRGNKKKPGRYFGPYPNARSVRDSLLLIQKLFKLRQCNDVFFSNRTRPCLQYQIKRCTAPCVRYVDEQAYRQQVDDTLLFLEGKNDQIMNRLAARMEQAASILDYEQAAHYRNQITQLRQLKRATLLGSAMNTGICACFSYISVLAV